MKVVSLLPSATEILFAIGAGIARPDLTALVRDVRGTRCLEGTW